MDPTQNETIQNIPSQGELKEWKAIIDSSPLGILLVIIIAFAKVRKDYLFDKQNLEMKLDQAISLLNDLKKEFDKKNED